MFTGNVAEAARDSAPDRTDAIKQKTRSEASQFLFAHEGRTGTRNVVVIGICGLRPREHLIRVVKLSSVSTGWLSALLHVHVRPINLVVFQGTFGLNPTKPHLGAGFTLICFQRLSFPFIAIQPCR